MGGFLKLIFVLSWTVTAVASTPTPLRLKDLIGPTQVIYFGESHSNTASKTYLSARIFELKSLGITHIALEMFAEGSQPLLDAYALGEHGSDEEILKYLSLHWGWLPHYYLQLLDAARRAQVKVVALDRRPYSVATGDGMQQRDDEYMAGVLGRLAWASPNNKILVLIGSAHVNKTHSVWSTVYQPDLLLREYGVSSVSYDIVPLHDSGWNGKHQSVIDGMTGPYEPGVAGWVKGHVYYNLESDPWREELRKKGVSPDETFLKTDKNKSGFDGEIFIDRFNEDAQAVANP